MIYIYASRGSQGARDLAKEVGGRRLKTPPRSLKPEDLLVNWGEESGLCGPNVLNESMRFSKLKELTALELKKIPVPRTSLSPKKGFVGRRESHTGGNDLLQGASLTNPDFYVEKLPITREFRIHVWRIPGSTEFVSVRAGIKVPRTDHPHEWIRSWDAGWKLDYGEICQQYLKQRVREVAKATVSTMSLDFGAVDVGVLPDGSVVVFEVNKAPGLEGNTLRIYGDKIKAFAERSN